MSFPTFDQERVSALIMILPAIECVHTCVCMFLYVCVGEGGRLCFGIGQLQAGDRVTH